MYRGTRSEVANDTPEIMPTLMPYMLENLSELEEAEDVATTFEKAVQQRLQTIGKMTSPCTNKAAVATSARDDGAVMGIAGSLSV